MGAGEAVGEVGTVQDEKLAQTGPVEPVDSEPTDDRPVSGAHKPRRGELRIYLGAAPGVGKTFAMLGEARRRIERGSDVVAGLVETHGRNKTAELLDGIETIPRKTMTHRGHEFTEMDTDAILARKPEIVLVDELAHTNVPGSKHEKRWQDVEDLLEAGIEVLATVNVQHLESLNDVVERITGVAQHETVPDEVVRKAEQIELVDITPEALRRRLAHGNVYPAQRIDAALANYFRVGNLTALRELALLWVADQVDIALQRYRAEQQITDTWEARERIVVAITGGPESETLIRRARRIANRAGAELLVLHVLRGDGLADAPPDAVLRYRKLADDVGATYHQVFGEDVPSALLDFARGVNATQLVIGTSRRSRLARLFSEGIGTTVVHQSGPIDVHMVTHAEANQGLRTQLGRSPLAPSRKVLGWALAILLPAFVTGGGLIMHQVLDISTNAAGFVLATVAVALVGGLGPALLSALLGGVLLNFFFVPPTYTLTIATPENLVTLITMMVVAVLVALVFDRAARRATQAAQARTEAALLASYARTVLTNPMPLVRLLEKVQENFGLTSVALLERDADGWKRVACVGGSPCDEPDEADVDVPVTPDVHLALRGRALPAADRQVLEAAAGQALLALRQQRMSAKAAAAQRRAETTELRTALLSAVGHDLRTPLTSIKAAISSLRDPELRLSEEDTGELLATVEESADRLAGLVDNLLDSSRLATGAVEPTIRPVGYYEAVARALSGIDERTLVDVDVDEHLPLVLADAGLLERVIANVIDNALRYGRGRGTAGEEAQVAVRASSYQGHVELRVVDHGPGLPKHASETVFAPFQRLGDRQSTVGVGLGLSVAKGFTEAMGGTIRIEDTPSGGLTVVISLPATGAPQAAPPSLDLEADGDGIGEVESGVTVGGSSSGAEPEDAR
jgi:two-component system, OmpR family, sensor histidine kinase KdpD